LAIVAVVLVVLGTWFGIHSRQGSQGNSSFGRNSGPPEVVTVVVRRAPIPIREELPGRTGAYRVAQIRPQVSGIIEKRLFQEGSEVEAGQHLYRLDASVYQAAMESARANLEQARASAHVAELKARRYRDLLGSKSISQQDYDDAEATLQQARASVSVAQAAVKTARLNLAYTNVDAPIAGRIGKSLVTEGSLVTANQSEPLAVITQLDPIYVDIRQSSAENMNLRQKLGERDKVPVSIVPEDAASPYAHKGRLQFSDVSVDESTGSVDLRALFPNPDHRLLPGMFVTATLDLGDENAIAVPQQVVSRDPQGRAFVWVVAGDDTVHRQIVTTERAFGDQWVISQGLAQGEVLVIEGVQRLKPGIKVVPHASGQGQ
jgi:membrane fusion protein (multidrug efflux system)